jgi:hypothetical protein
MGMNPRAGSEFFHGFVKFSAGAVKILSDLRPTGGFMNECSHSGNNQAYELDQHARADCHSDAHRSRDRRAFTMMRFEGDDGAITRGCV